jgi:hypothetical protein
MMPEEETRIEEEDTTSDIPCEEIETQIVETITRLRTAGHPNYQPAYGVRNET